MPLHLKRSGGTNVPLSLGPINPETQEYLLTANDSTAQVVFKSPLKLDLTVPHGDYQIVVLRNQFLVENSILQIYETSLSKRIGWIFPVQALESVEHSHYDNEHFLRYASAAVPALLSPEAIFTTERTDVVQAGSIRLSDFYADNLAVLALSRAALAEIQDFSLSNYLHCFFRYGFVLNIQNAHAAGKNSRTASAFGSLQIRLGIQSIPKNLQGDAFLKSLFDGSIEMNGHPLATFLILYQVFELLIERIFQSERSHLLKTLSTMGNSVYDVKIAVKNLQDAVSEEGRLRRLVSPTHLVAQPDWSGLKGACLAFLGEVGINAKSEFAGSLYPVRNKVVHEFRSVTPSALKALDEINSELLVLLPDLVGNYQEPVATVK